MKEKGRKWKSRISKDGREKGIITKGICYCPVPLTAVVLRGFFAFAERS